MRKTVVLSGWAFYLLVACLVGQVLTASPAIAAPAKADPKQVESLIKEGADALTANDVKTAHDKFTQATQLDPKNPHALHGLAIACFQLQDYAAAGTAIDQAVAIPGAVDHAMAFNAGVIELQNHQPMRAVKITRDYLTVKSSPPDEQVIDMLGLALEHADSQAEKTAYYADAKSFYDRNIKRLETANPGQMRWGAQWLPADDVQAKLKSNADVEPKVNDLTKELADTESQLAVANKKLAAVKVQVAKQYVDPSALDPVQADVDRLEADRTQKKSDLHDAEAQLLKPDPLPEITTLVAMDAVLASPEKTVVAASRYENIPHGIPAHTAPKPPAGYKPVEKSPAKTAGETQNPSAGTADKPADPATPPAAPATSPVDPTATDPAPASPKKVRENVYAVAFPVANDLVITSAAAVDSVQDLSLQFRDGSNFTGTVVRTDAATGLALVRVANAKLAYLDLADAKAGDVQCAAIVDPNVFAPVGEMIPATAPAPADHWTIQFTKLPRLAGAPLIQDGKVVGVALSTRDSKADAIPAVSSAAVKALLGQDAPQTAGRSPDPLMVLMQISATRERDEN